MTSNESGPGGPPTRREDDVLERIAAILSPSDYRGEEIFIGDDTAVLRPLVGQALISTDTAVYGVHLDDRLFSLHDLGFKAMTSAISDIAAMGGWVRGAVVAVAAPPGIDLETLHQGIAEAALLTGCPVVGGDLTRAPHVAVTVTVLGECPSGGAVLRRGARPGDTIFVTAPLGRAAAGWRRAREGAALSEELVLAHRRPWPRLREGRIARRTSASAMMDLSDGIALDLHRLADASQVGFALDDIPIASGATFEEALAGGEDYELVFTSSDPAAMRAAFVAEGLSEPIAVGVIVADPSERTLAGEELHRRGWQHEL